MNNKQGFLDRIDNLTDELVFDITNMGVKIREISYMIEQYENCDEQRVKKNEILKRIIAKIKGTK